MLLNLVAIVIGFATVMLLLSFFVMSLVQMTQHVFRLRVRNFESGIEGLLRAVKKPEDTYDPGSVAREVVTAASLPASRSGGLFGRVLSWTVQGKCTWLTEDELAAVLDRGNDTFPDVRIADVRAAFSLTERQMSRSLLVMTRYAAVFWSAIVAFYFQLSAPALLERLTTDAVYRDRVSSAGEMALSRTSGETGSSPGIADNASPPTFLNELQFRGILAPSEKVTGKPDAARQTTQDPVVAANDSLAELAWLDVTPWPHGPGYYAKTQNCVGVLMTAILLTLGAPFWFNLLKNVVNLRDMLKPPESTTPAGE